jgi:transposase
VKTEVQQAVLAMHRMREQLLKIRTMQINALCGLMAEYGEVIGSSLAALEREILGATLRRTGTRQPPEHLDYPLQVLHGCRANLEAKAIGNTTLDWNVATAAISVRA